MRKSLLHILFVVPLLAFGQIDQLVTMGPGYGNQVYYSLSTGETTAIPLTTWDIAFSVANRDASVFVNESVNSSQANPTPEVEVYHTAAADFESADTTNIIDRVYNKEITWAEGAFNSILDEQNPFDLGWGAYNPATNTVNSSTVFFIKLRNGEYKKLQIVSLISGVYTVRYADLDNSNEVTHEIDKADYAGKTLAYLSVEQDSVMDLEPDSWDMLFTRYWTPLDDGTGTGNILDYMVTGVLTNTGVEVAQVDSIDPATVSFADYSSALSDSSLYIIGHDWKNFSLATFSWSLPADRVYFVKTASDSVWKVQFIGFEGSSTGVAAVRRTFADVATSIKNTFEQVSSYNIYPNPTQGDLNLEFSLIENISAAQLEVRNQLGQLIHQETLNVFAGENTKKLDIPLSQGVYFVSLRNGSSSITKKVICLR